MNLTKKLIFSFPITQVARPVVHALPQSNRPRFTANTPRPTLNKSNAFKPITRSPPPFEAPAPSVKATKADEIFPQNMQLQPTNNIALLTRGISLLSITQLRDLLRDYSLPTGGNKHVLVNRLIIFLETIGQSQQNLLSAFSAKLKKLLSIDADESASPSHSEEGSPTPQMQPAQTIPPEISQSLLQGSPSSLYELSDNNPAFGPVLISVNMNNSHSFTITTADKTLIPILQFVSAYPTVVISRIVIQIDGTFLTMRGPNFYTEMKQFMDRPTSFQVVSVEPETEIVGAIRWMKQVSIHRMIQMICMKEPARKMPLSGSSIPNGICPLTRKVIVRPGRGVNCMHGECYDISGFLCNAIKNNSWQCPICRKQVTLEEIRIDPFYFALASGSPV
ncbi:SAP domain containing protein [Trichomonas vaginalis G3]|uniref:SAP domain containing protein n=1 Tax=Trichomonas vaginalis (strain ATCC PRA-98 / G3) TaxID=412133 RepID=A2G4A6_TRIV3|nr:SUMO transferase protein [Trichomonas vaginalis G3]EAX88006.1 SAP domain containing protein [Trichomonas vaginalis G3]KAI5519957.1 SUMO transferase protein [Trichomonas vaginalis G3]|eukprot:XP_001300936.1 SAP domain containing protein [Trichomonas vaginalis G3]